jgi:hypothetical protein
VKNVVKKTDPKTSEYVDQDVKLAEKMADNVKEPSKLAFTFRKVYDPDTDKFEYSEVDIEASGLRNLLKKTITHYPEEQWDSNVVDIRAPFAPLIYHWDTLVELAKIGFEGEEILSAEVIESRTDLRRLLDHVQTSPELESYFKTRAAHQKSQLITYDTLWTLFAPETQIIGKPFMDMPQVFEVQSTPYYTPPSENMADSEGETKKWSAICVALDWTGKYFKRVPFNLEIERFSGPKPTRSLEFYPFDFCEDKEAMEKNLIERGAQCRDILFKTRKGGKEKMFEYTGDIISAGGLQDRISQSDVCLKGLSSDDYIAS